MKKLLLALFLVTGLCARDKILKNVEVFSSEFSTQAILFFSDKCNPRQKVNDADSRLSVFFPAIRMGQVDQGSIASGLNKFGLIEKLRLENINQTINGKSIHGVLLDIKFASDKALVKLIHVNEKNKFIVEVYSKTELEKLSKSSEGPLHLAFNDLKKKKNAKLRVMLDAGHGGKATGAKGLYNLVEKDVTLDIARRLKPILEQAGIEVYLTRKTDKNVSLVDRCKKTMAVNADLFVSIHANSAGCSHEPHGIETFHLNSDQFVSGKGAASYKFLFVKKNDQALANLANSLIKRSETQSYKFAGSIQNSLINLIRKRNVNINNRGVKKACFLVLLGLITKDVPSALVEVGFITNKDEAKRLTSSNYRTLIAQGIAKGIKSYLNKV